MVELLGWVLCFEKFVFCLQIISSEVSEESKFLRVDQTFLLGKLDQEIRQHFRSHVHNILIHVSDDLGWRNRWNEKTGPSLDQN